MKKEVKFSLVFRDMWQSAGKYVPRVDQLVKVAPAIIEMGCFARVETNVEKIRTVPCANGQSHSTKPVYRHTCSTVL